MDTGAEGRGRHPIRAIVLALGVAGPAVAAAESPQQGAEPAAPTDAAATAQPATDDAASATAAPAGAGVQTIVVTGSRIIRRQPNDFALSNPVVSVSAEEIGNSGTTNLADFLRELPALTGSISSHDASGSNAFVGGTGLELLNLRNLGIDRTLVLVDGRRHVAGLPGSAAVDIDTIPIGLIQDIEILTGGASALYGADGVSGVVNFITKRDFEGLDVKVQYGQSRHTEPREMLASVIGGQNFADGRGNITLAFEYSGENRLEATDRDYAGGLGRRGFARNPNDRTDDPNVPDRIPLNDIRFYDSSRNGAVYVFDVNGDIQLFDGDDTAFDRGTIPAPDPSDPFSAPIDPFFQQGGDGTPQRDYIGDLLARQDRYTFNSLFTYDWRDNASLYADLKYSHTRAYTESQPTFDFFLFVAPDNPYIPPTINATSDGTGVYVSRDNFDLGTRSEDIDRDTYRAVIGNKGDFSADMHFDVSVVYGRTEVRNRIGNNRFNDRFAAAIDAVTGPGGEITCRSNLDPTAAPLDNLIGQGWDGYTPLPGTWAGSFTPGAMSGCVPVNLFGDGSVSPEATAWINATSLATSQIEQWVGQAVLSGETFNWFVPKGKPMGYALGVERRVENSEGHPASEDQRGLTFGNVLQPDQGTYGVSEAFLEINVPMVHDQPFAKSVSVDAAVRLSKYSTVGNTRTWKAGGNWTIVDDVALRGTRAKATRAPNISELFDPGGQTFLFIDDPCDIDLVNQGSQYRQANCNALLTSLGVDPATYTDPNSASIPGTLKGNRNLDEEDADTKTLGIVLQPRFLPGLSLSVDWYDIQLDNAINVATAQEAADICVDSPSLDNPFCALQTREAGTGAIVDFLQQPVNVAKFTTEGYDLSLLYRIDPAEFGVAREIGQFRLRVVGNKLEDLTFINLPGSPPDSDAGEGPRENDGVAPDWQLNLDLTWTLRSFEFNYGYSYFSATERFTRQVRAGEPDIADPRYFNYEGSHVHDVFAAYRFGKRYRIYGGVNNLLDNEPAAAELAFPVSPIGRFFYAGVEVKAF